MVLFQNHVDVTSHGSVAVFDLATLAQCRVTTLETLKQSEYNTSVILCVLPTWARVVWCSGLEKVISFLRAKSLKLMFPHKKKMR